MNAEGVCGGLVERNGLAMAVEFEPLLRSHHLDSIDRLFADELGERLDKPGLASWRQRRRVELPFEGKAVTLFVKRFENPPGSARRLVKAAGNGARSVAGVEWSWMHRLRRDGIACARPVSLGEEMAGGREARSVLVSAAVAGQSLERWMGKWHALAPGTAREVVMGVARLVSRLHRKGYVHRDLYLSHVFYDDANRVDEGLCLIDLQRIVRPTWRRGRWIVKDLASLHFSAPSECISRTQRLRWLLVYLGIGKLNAAGRRLAYKIVGKAIRIGRRERRHDQRES